MPQLDLYIWSISISFFLVFFFIFYFFIVNVLLVNIVRTSYFKKVFVEFINYMQIYMVKYKLWFSFGLMANIFFSLFNKKTTLLKRYNQLIALNLKNLKILNLELFFSKYNFNEFFFIKGYIFNFIKYEILNKIKN